MISRFEEENADAVVVADVCICLLVLLAVLRLKLLIPRDDLEVLFGIEWDVFARWVVVVGEAEEDVLGPSASGLATLVCSNPLRTWIGDLDSGSE